jgi:Na+(H+)/acetate symporter ActP
LKALTDGLLRIAKALMAGVSAGGAIYLADASGGGMTTTAWEQVAGTVLVIGFLTWAVPNKPPAVAVTTTPVSGAPLPPAG